MIINLSRTAVQNVLALINAKNGLQLTTAEVTLGEPMDFDGGLENERNTQVELAAVPGSGYVNSVMVRYWRLDLDVLKGVRVLAQTKNETSTVESVTDAVATQLDVIADQIELVDENGDVLEALPVLGGTPAELTVRAKASSYTYLGSTTMTLNPIPVTEEEMEDTVLERDLDGFEYPEDESAPGDGEV